ncbi:MAG TPA: hypothetical protein VNL71_03750 [Chloroflexota bacterium]|nr:hypothetical protein [Chloroflexota bacterium]
MKQVKHVSLGCVLALTLAGGLGSRSVSAATAPAPLAKVSMALAGLTSYQVDYSVRSTQNPPSIEKDVYVVLHHGSRRIDRVAAMHPSGVGDTTVIEDVISGSRDCERYPVTAPFSCSQNPSLSASITGAVDPGRGLSGKGVSVHFHAAAAKMVAGVKCTGYAFTLHTPTEHGSGVLYVSPSVNFPCEEDATLVGPAIGPTTAGATQTLISTWTWRRFNDPKLKVPAVPAS